MKKQTDEKAPGKPDRQAANEKLDDLLLNKETGLGEGLTTNQGTGINDNQNTLFAGRLHIPRKDNPLRS